MRCMGAAFAVQRQRRRRGQWLNSGTKKKTTKSPKSPKISKRKPTSRKNPRRKTKSPKGEVPFAVEALVRAGYGLTPPSEAEAEESDEE